MAVQQLDEMVESFEQDPEAMVRERAITLLQAVDAVHRPGITRLAAYLDAAGPGLRERALADPAIRLLFELYELLPAEPASPPGFVPLSELRVKRASGSHQ
jgi:predicted RNA polymerase sigma factor